MNSYIIAPNNSDYVDLIEKYACIERVGRGRKSSIGTKPGVVTSRRAFNNESFKGLFDSPTDTDTIFIVPELRWDDDQTFQAGYKVAEELITDKLAADSFVNILFVSGLPRELLSTMFAKTEYAGLVQSFPHMTLDDIREKLKIDDERSRKKDIKDNKNLLPVPFYSRIQYELLKRVVVSKSGKLDHIKHKLAHLTRIDTKNPEKERADILAAKDSLNGYLTMLLLPSFCDECSPQHSAVKQCLNDLPKANTKEDIQKLVASLKQIIDDIQNHKHKASVATSKNSGEGYRVLIVEDDAFFRESMTAFFKMHLGPKTDVVVYDNAMIMGNPFPDKPDPAVKDARSRIVEEVGKYNIVILDMMYTADGKEDSPSALFNGFDLYNALRDAEVKEQKRHAVVRVITALPRNDISRLVKRYVTAEPPVVFTKGNGWEQLEGCLLDRMDEILKECEKNEESYLEWVPFPKRGVFRHPGMYEAIFADPGKLKLATDFARDVASGKHKMTADDCELTSKKDPKELVGHLRAIMANRKLVIKFLLSGKAPFCQEYKTPYFDEEKYRGFIDDYLSDEAKQTKKDRSFDKGYICTKLGFKISQLPDPNRGNLDVLSEKEKKPQFRGRIDLDDYLQFFPGELDSPEEEATPDVLVRWMKYTSKILESERNVSERHLAEPCRQSGVNAYLNGERTLDSYRKMLEGVGGYLHSKEPPFAEKKDLQNVFIRHLDLRDYPIAYKKIRAYSENLAGLIDGIVDFVF